MPTKSKKSTGRTRARRAELKVSRAKLNGRGRVAKASESAGPLAAVTVAAKELKDRAVETGRKVDFRKAAPGAAAVTAVVATGLLWRRKKK